MLSTSCALVLHFHSPLKCTQLCTSDCFFEISCYLNSFIVRDINIYSVIHMIINVNIHAQIVEKCDCDR